MNTETFIHLLKQPENIDKKHTPVLQSIINEYPYFQSARAIYLRGLKKEGSFKYNSELKITAAHTSDRTMLFDFITSPLFTEEPILETTEVHQQIAEKIKGETKIETKEELQIGKPISFTTSETHSFNEWLQLSSAKKIERKEIAPEKELDKNTIIDNFIQQNPKITRVSKHTENSIIIPESTTDSHIMTETLATVYLEQKKYESAIKAYEILSLKYPEKSGFFADQIKRVRILQKNKS